MLIKHLYGDDDEMVRSLFCSDIESTIILSMVEEDKIMEWLESAGKTEIPVLLYRASRDGWDASDFHRMFNGKGATVTVVKSSDGYIFGEYTDVAWGQSGVCKKPVESFMFSLKDHAGVGTVKMPIKSNNTCHAVCHGHVTVLVHHLDTVPVSVLPRMQTQILHHIAMLAVRINFQAIPLILTS